MGWADATPVVWAQGCVLAEAEGAKEAEFEAGEEQRGAVLAAVPRSEAQSTIETRASWAVCVTALGIAAVSFAAPAITVVGLKSITADLGGERSVPALAYSLAWLGASVAGIAMGQAPSGWAYAQR